MSEPFWCKHIRQEKGVTRMVKRWVIHYTKDHPLTGFPYTYTQVMPEEWPYCPMCKDPRPKE